MTFLDPISGLIAAAVSVPLLLLLYFLKLRRRPLRVSSTLLWEQAVRDLQVNVPLRWLKVSTALLLQLLALLALVGALARPAIPSQAPTADRTTIVIDQSASMSARDGAQDNAAAQDAPVPTSPPGQSAVTRLAEAKRRAIELVRELSRGTTTSGERPAVTVIASATNARVVQSASTVTADVIDAIESIEPTDLPGGINAAAELLEAARGVETTGAISETPGASTSEVVVAFTDRAEREPSSLSTQRGRIIRVGGHGSTGPSAGSGAAAAPPSAFNTGIVALSVRRDVEKPDTVRVFARIASTSAAAQTLVVRFLADNQLMGVRRVEVPARSPGTAKASESVGGDATVTFEFDRRDGAVVLVAFDSADLLDCDNAAGAVIGPVASPSILVVTPTPSAGGGADGLPGAADPFLLGFLESLHPRALRMVEPAAFEAEMGAARAEQRPPYRTFNLIVFDRVTPSAIPTQPSISFGAGLPLPGLSLTAAPDPARRTVRFDTWRRSHPLMRYVALEPIVISPAPATIATESAGDGPVAQISVLASGPDGPLIAAAEQPGLGPRRIVVSFPLLRSNWGPDTSFAVFMANAVDLLTGRGDAAVGRWTAAGQPLTVRAAGEGSGRVIEAVGPETLSAEVRGPADQPAQSAISLGVPNRVGVYQLTGADQPAACVNLLDEAETLLGTPTDGAAARPGISEDGQSTRPIADAETAPRKPEGRREIWHWFVLAAMALAAIEWVVFAAGIRS